MVIGYDNQTPVPGRMNKPEGEVFDVSQLITKEGFLSESEFQRLIDQGKIFIFDNTKEGVAQNGTYNVLIETGTKRLRTRILYSSEFKSRFRSYFNPVVTPGTGTLETPFNLMPDTDKVLLSTVKTDCTHNAAGQRGNQVTGAGGSNNTKAGGNSNSELESDFPPNSKIVFELTNLNNGAAYLGFIIIMYEKE